MYDVATFKECAAPAEASDDPFGFAPAEPTAPEAAEEDPFGAPFAATGAQGEGGLAGDAGNPVQLSGPSAISDAPWRLLKVYEDERDSTTTLFRPGTRLAVTIPTTDPQRGRLAGVAVQLMTLVRDENGEVFDLPHGEWSVRLQWDRVPPAPQNPAPKNPAPKN